MVGPPFLLNPGVLYSASLSGRKSEPFSNLLHSMVEGGKYRFMRKNTPWLSIQLVPAGSLLP